MLPAVTSVRDLGVTVTSNLSPSTHIRDIVSRAHKRALAIHRSFVSRDTNMLVRAYKTYVRPMVEHNSVIWSPHNIQDIQEIERVQRKFTKRLRGYHSYSYEERLKLLKLQSLELRRLLTDLCWCYKIVFGLVDTDIDDFFELSTVTHTRGHKYKLFKKHSALNVRSSFFSERVLNVWNKMPENINFSSFKVFKHSIENTDFSMFLKGF